MYDKCYNRYIVIISNKICKYIFEKNSAFVCLKLNVKKLFNIATCTLFSNEKMPSNEDGNFCIGHDIGLIFLLLAHTKLIC